MQLLGNYLLGNYLFIFLFPSLYYFAVNVSNLPEFFSGAQNTGGDV
jgi:hypothetical protein